jgi:uncharacterized protein (TIGR00369 family)
MIPSVLDQFQTPRCAELLGFDLVEADPTTGRVKVRFAARSDFCNASGAIQGGMIAAMLDDAMGPAVLIKTKAEMFPSTIAMTITYLAPARPGELMAEARVIQLGKSIGNLEAELRNADGGLIARACASVRLTAMEKATVRRDRLIS